MIIDLFLVELIEWLERAAESTKDGTDETRERSHG